MNSDELVWGEEISLKFKLHSAITIASEPKL